MKRLLVWLLLAPPAVVLACCLGVSTVALLVIREIEKQDAALWTATVTE